MSLGWPCSPTFSLPGLDALLPMYHASMYTATWLSPVPSRNLLLLGTRPDVTSLWFRFGRPWDLGYLSGCKGGGFDRKEKRVVDKGLVVKGCGRAAGGQKKKKKE